MEQIYLKTQSELYTLDISNIVRVESKSNYTRIYCKDRLHPITISKVMHVMLELLPQHLFVRVHHAHAVNINYIKTITKLPNAYCRLTTGDKVAISRRKFKTLSILN
jgi:two-component system, LytTR family, response regulator